jgi:tetratricopeptide (TPR) repeat protein
VTVGEALRRWGRHAEARERLTAAVAVLRDDPDTDTVRALGDLAALEVLAGTPEAGDLSAEALALGQDLAADDATLAELFTLRGLWHTSAGRRPEAAAYFREAARLATQADDTLAFGRALLNLSDAVTGTDPATGAEAARTAVTHLRRAGARNHLAVAVTNLALALLMTGDWDGADTELARTADGDDLADIEFLDCFRAWLAALRGDAETARATVAGLGDLRVSEDPQDQANIALAEALTAAAEGQPAAALGCARTALGHADAIGISADMLLWAWPLAARAAHELADTATTSELLALLDRYRPGQLAPMLRAERDLTRARLGAASDDPGTGAAFAAAVAALRQKSTPYHLAHGLLDHAEHLLRVNDGEAATAAIDEARGIAQRLRCQPLLDRIESMTSAAPRIPV